MQLPNITEILFHTNGILILKIPFLILLFLYALFLFIVISRIRALNRTITVTAGAASQILRIAAVLQFVLAVSLFLITLVIV
jgi:hypothetical protein